LSVASGGRSKRLVIEEVRVTGWDVEIRLRIPIDEGPRLSTSLEPGFVGTRVRMAGRRRCQAMIVCVPLFVLWGNSYRLKDQGKEVMGPPKAR